MRRGGLRSWSLLLSLEQGKQRHVGNFNDLESNTRNVSNSMSFSSETRNQNFIVFFNIVQTTIVGYKSCDFLAVFDQLNTNTLSDSRVRLFGFNTNFFQYNSFSMRSSAKGIGFQSCTQMCLFVSKIMPALFTTKSSEFASYSDTTWLSHCCE